MRVHIGNDSTAMLSCCLVIVLLLSCCLGVLLSCWLFLVLLSCLFFHNPNPNLFPQGIRILDVQRDSVKAEAARLDSRMKQHVWRTEIKERALQRRLRLEEVCITLTLTRTLL